MVSLDGPWGRVDEPTDEMWLFGCFRDFVLLLIAISWFWQMFLRTYIELREKMPEETNGFSRQIVVEFLQLIGKQWLLPLLLTLAWNLIPDSALQSNLSRITYLAFLLKLNVEIYTGDSADEPTPQAKVRKRDLLQIEARIGAYVSASTADRLLSGLLPKASDVAASQERARFAQRGDLSLLRCNQPQNVDLEGIPSSSTSEDVVEFLLKIDPNLDFAPGATQVRVQPPALLRNNHNSPTTKAIVTNLVITSHVKRFIERGDSSVKVPLSLYIRRYFRSDNRLEIPTGRELKRVIETLENAGWLKREIESFLLELVCISLHSPKAFKSAATLRINVTRFEGPGKVMRRVPCSQGRILLLFNDAASVADIVAGMPTADSAEFEKLAVSQSPTPDRRQGVRVGDDNVDAAYDKIGDSIGWD